MTTSVASAGEVTVEGEHLGRIEGFRFVPDSTEGHADQKAVLSAALRALRQDLPARLQAFTGSADGELVFDSQLRVCWGGGPIARLLPSGDVLSPKLDGREALAVMAQAFAAECLDGVPSASGAAVGVRIVRMLAAAQRSLEQQGARVALAEAPSED